MKLHLPSLCAILAAGAISAFGESVTNDFQAADLGSAYTQVSGEWSAADGLLEVSGDRNKILVLNAPAFGAAPFTVTSDFKVSDPAAEKCAVGLFVSYNDLGDYVLARFRGGSSNTMQIVARKGEKEKVKALPPGQPLKPDVWYRLTIKSTGDGNYDISLVERDAADKIVASGALRSPVATAPGKVGFYMSNQTFGNFDNFSVKTD